MHDRLRELWTETVQRLLAEPRSSHFAAWLEGARPVGLDGRALVVEIPNLFARDWLDTYYRERLRLILREVAGDGWDIKLTVPRSLAGADTAPSPFLSPPPPAPHSASFPPPLLNPRYTFDSFVVGDSNRFAYAASLAVAESLVERGDLVYNPLFVYGGVGLGKTHLMQAIAQYVRAEESSLRIVYVTTEQFANELIDALQRKSMPDFRARYRSVDLLLVDDVQFLAGKEMTQEEFFHTFNALYEAGKQIVVSSDRTPKEIPTVEERLRSRFEWGLLADIQAPDLETRIAILQAKAAGERLNVPLEVIHYIAEHIDTNIREMEGALVRVIAASALTSRPITRDLAQEVLQPVIRQRQLEISIPLIQQVVADHFSIRREELLGKKRTRAVAFPRQLAMFLARELTDASLPRIGEEFGGRDHTTVLHACEKLHSQQRADPRLAATLEELKRKVNEAARGRR